MIHFLISHSISLYCQMEGKKGTDRDMVGGGMDEEESKQKEKWRAETEIKKKGKRRISQEAKWHVTQQ